MITLPMSTRVNALFVGVISCSLNCQFYAILKRTGGH